MFKLESFEEFFLEKYTATLGLKKNKWEDINPSDHPAKLADEFYELIQIAYQPIGGHVKIKTPSDVFKDPKWNSWELVDIDNDPEADLIIFSNQNKYGKKWSGVGHDGSKIAKKVYLNSRAQDLKKRGHYGEVSMKLAEILLKSYNVPVVSDRSKVEKILGKKVKWYGKHPTDPDMPSTGWYSREIGGHEHIKILVGQPKI